MGNTSNQKAANKWLSVPIIATVCSCQAIVGHLKRGLSLKNRHLFLRAYNSHFASLNAIRYYLTRHLVFRETSRVEIDDKSAVV